MAESRDAAGSGDETASAESAPLHVVNLPAILAPSASDSARSHSKRFLMLAASVAFAAGFGSFVGSVSGSGLVRLIYPPSAPMSAPAAPVESTAAVMHEIRLELAEVSALKTSVQNAAQNTTSEYAKLADRLDRVDQRAGGVDQRAGEVETTGSLPPALSAAADQPKLSDRVLQDWIVHDVQNGRALIESRCGALFDVGAGSVLPGIGRVDMIKRQDGHWVVLTARGTITSAR
jgi:hypothetical protein